MRARPLATAAPTIALHERSRLPRGSTRCPPVDRLACTDRPVSVWRRSVGITVVMDEYPCAVQDRPLQNSADVTATRDARIVRIAYRPFHHPAPSWDPEDMGHGYAYMWELPTPPAIGDRVVLGHYRGQSAVVVGFGTEYRGDLCQVHRRATERELRIGREKLAANEAKWVALIRSVAGLNPERLRRGATPGFPRVADAIPGRATEQDSYEALQMWRHASEYARRHGWPDAERRRLDQIVSDWKVVKTAGGNYCGTC